MQWIVFPDEYIDGFTLDYGIKLTHFARTLIRIFHNYLKYLYTFSQGVTLKDIATITLEDFTHYRMGLDYPYDFLQLQCAYLDAPLCEFTLSSPQVPMSSTSVIFHGEYLALTYTDCCPSFLHGEESVTKSLFGEEKPVTNTPLTNITNTTVDNPETLADTLELHEEAEDH